MAGLDTNQVYVRRATHADCAGIKAIVRGLHDGNDRFLYVFHKHIHQGTTFPYVAELSGEIVAYTCGEIKDDGEVMIMSEGRVSEKLRGRAVINKLNAVLLQAAIAKFPRLQKMMWCSANKTSSHRAVKTHTYMDLVHSFALEVCEIPAATLKALCESNKFHQLEEKYLTNAVTMIPKCHALRLLTEEIRFLDYAPIRPIIGWQPSGWHCSTLAAELQETELFITRASSGGEIEGFSLLTTSRNDKGSRFDMITYCGVGDRGAELVIAHILYSLRETATWDLEASHVTVTFFFPSHVDRKAVLGVLNGKLGIPSNVNNDGTGFMLEYKIPGAAQTKSML